MRILNRFILCLLFILVAVSAAQAHQYPDFDNSLGLTIDRDTLTLEYRIWYGPILIPGLGMDASGDGRLDEDEMYAYMEKTDQKIQEGLEILMDGAPLEINPMTSTISNSGDYPRMSLDIALWYSARIVTPSEPGDRLITIRDTNFSSYGPERKLFFINTASKAGDIRVTRDGTEIRVAYADAGGFGMSTGLAPEKADEATALGARTSKENSRQAQAEDSRLTGFLKAGDMGPAMLFAAFATAFILGAGHALSPGHGKAMVAAYLVGTRGRKRDAVFLGLVVTFTHVISVIILGLVALYLSTRILPEQIFPWLSVASGVLIFITGFFLLVRDRAGHHHRHSHDHDHPHPHETGHSHGSQHAPGLWSLIFMGIAGGMVPCPSAMVVLLVAISLHKIALGLALITVFSLGLAAVLVGIGIAVVSMSGISSAVDRFAPIVRILPLFGAGLVLLLGIAITARSLMEAGMIRIVGL